MCNFSKLNANLTAQVYCVPWRGLARQLLSTVSIHDSSPLSLHMAELIKEGLGQEVSSVNDGLVMPQGGEARGQWGREERGVEEGWLPKPNFLKLKGGLSPEHWNGFYQKCPFHTRRGMALPSELFCGHCLICSQALISSNCTAVATEVLWGSERAIFVHLSCSNKNLTGFPGGSVVKNLPAMQEIQVRSQSWEDPLEKETATHFSTLAWKSHRQRSLAGYSPWGCKRFVHYLVTKQHQQKYHSLVV